ncbi:hypothetical protein P9027_31365 [Bacillus thuringiensis]|uniref:hypothetical protein n=1 Tax=Bacillus cereus group TaxID=86661 RepID=UPI000BFC0DD5|nr:MULTISPECIES: hypothetical protein [Bacillus cereus group]MEC3226404.1 hypothetical protein [Bacillus thuringiensis]MEC3463141.1 hypothetical protein [Bacillus thuringiensis]MEC3553546.1 hypothetical protein [Bacillus thuringiensis]MED2059970.1 hypothetical protein [Bacillus thuringiensis]PHB32877.1 hypothetical protein COE86_23745 [Bacillus toyonensis]
MNNLFLGEGIPAVKLSYDLADVSTSTSNWLEPLWLPAAFAIGLSLAFYVIGRLKGVFGA